MYLEEFAKNLKFKWKGSLFSVEAAQAVHKRAKEYLHRLEKAGVVERVCWGWYYFPYEFRDVWEFLRKDEGFKILIRQTASCIWNYDFIHRNVYRLAVKDRSYKRALEAFAKKRGWIFEIEVISGLENKIKFKKIDGLLVEDLESCIVNCMAEWSFLDAISALYFRRDEASLRELKQLGRWKRISKTEIRIWNAIKYACNTFNENLGRKIFNVRNTRVSRPDIRELIDESVEKVVEFA